jgi:hypothetical protein
MLAPVKLHRRWRPHSWSHQQFQATPWAQLADHYWELTDATPVYLTIIEIIDSVRASGAGSWLAAARTIGALNVVSVDAAEPPYSVISVSIIPAGRTAPGVVQVEHVSCSGLTEVIVRPLDNGVPLFWRFVIEKFGVQPAATSAGEPA